MVGRCAIKRVSVYVENFWNHRYTAYRLYIWKTLLDPLICRLAYFVKVFIFQCLNGVLNLPVGVYEAEDESIKLAN